MEQIDRDAQRQWGFPELVLMEQAGIKGWNAFLENTERQEVKTSKLLFVAGGGNNGGDALVMARQAYLDDFKHIGVLLVGSHISNACLIQRTMIASLGLTTYELSVEAEDIEPQVRTLIEHADIIIDGLAGTGLRGSLTGKAAFLVKLLNGQRERGAHIWAIDIPSGCSDTLQSVHPNINANITATMGLKKAVCYHPGSREAWGKVIVVNPSFPPQLLARAEKSALLCDESDIEVVRLKEDSYKNKRGHIGIFAGSRQYTGAPRLAAKAAFHSRAGLVTICCDDEISSVVATTSPTIIVRSIMKGETILADELVSEFSSLVAGPGWGFEHEQQLFEILASGIPTVLDADAITIFASLFSKGKLANLSLNKVVLTPHPGELHRMLERLGMPLLAQETSIVNSSSESFIESMHKIAAMLHVVLVYRSHVVWLFDGNGEYSVPMVVDGMNNALGVAGSGDVFAGIIGAMLAQHAEPMIAAVNAAVIHQKAGMLARTSHGWFDSDELTEYVGHACRLLEQKAI